MGKFIKYQRIKDFLLEFLDTYDFFVNDAIATRNIKFFMEKILGLSPFLRLRVRGLIDNNTRVHIHLSKWIDIRCPLCNWINIINEQ